MKILYNNIKILLISLLALTACASYEATLGYNLDAKTSTVDLAMGYNKEDAFNILAFGGLGTHREDKKSSISYYGINYEYYFSDTVGISTKFGQEYRKHTERVRDKRGYNREEEIRDKALLFNIGVPFSWSYGKITPYIGAAFYDKPDFRIGISFAIRNQALAVTFIALGATAPQYTETGRIYNRRGRQVGTIYSRDYEQERQNQEQAAETITGIMGMPVEDKLPYPAYAPYSKSESIPNYSTPIKTEPIKTEPPIKKNIYNVCKFKAGTSKQTVRDIIGFPSGATPDLWVYEGTSIFFSNDIVTNVYVSGKKCN
ncbi:MAG: hypothetical protein LBP51_03780 [Deferribacteraceae bacterium]|jgi:hypothetical protein|nr:hypothetical protein [Deferribacteraceae bacterium]